MDTIAGLVLVEPSEIVLNEGIYPGALQPNRIEHAARVSDMCGVARPARGLSMMLLVTIAPSSGIEERIQLSTRRRTSLAVKTGLGKSIPASSTPVSACSIG